MSPQKYKINNGMNKLFSLDCESIKKAALELHKGEKCIPSVDMYKRLNISQKDVGGCHCYYVLPKNKRNDGEYIFYLYGGGTFMEINKEQWRFVERICNKTGMGVFVPLYPLAPEHSCQEVFTALKQVYAHLAKDTNIKRIVMLGDSSGAGLALSLSIVAWTNGLRKPDKMVLLSPVIDTEFFDKNMENMLQKVAEKNHKILYSNGYKEFINKYWLREFAAITEYTSPCYEEYTDVVDDVTILSGIGDAFNHYSRAFYNKLKKQGIRASLFEFEIEEHDFLIYSNSRKSKEAFIYLTDIILGKRNSYIKDLFQLKLIADWTKKMPDVIKDDRIMKYMYDEKIDFSELNTKVGQYNYLRLAATYKLIDDMVKQYMVQYPRSTIVYVGCRLDNAFERVDNGWINWYNVDSRSIMTIRRNIFGEFNREKTIGRDIMDLTWLDDIKCDKSKGIMFIFGDSINHCSFSQIEQILDKIHSIFPGSQIVVRTCSVGGAIANNLKSSKNALKRYNAKFYVNDTQRILDNWSADYKLLEEKPVFKAIGKQEDTSLFTKLRIVYNKISYNQKVIRIKLGGEKYDLKI